MSKILERAREAVRKKNYDYAVELFLQYLSAYPGEVKVRKELRQAEMKRVTELGATNGGAAAFFKGMGPWFKIELHRVRKNYDGMIIEIENYLKNDPRNVKMLIELGKAARGGGHKELAIDTLQDALSIDKANMHALRELGQIHREHQEYDESSAYYEKLLKLKPTDKEAQDAVRDNAAQVGQMKIKERTAGGDFRGMIKDADKQSALDKASQRVRTADQALELIDMAKKELDADPENMKIYRQMAELYVKAKKLDDALATIEKGLSVSEDAGLTEMKADIQMKILDKEIASVEKAAKSDANAKKKLKQLKADRLDFSIEEYQRRVEEHPTELGLRYHLGKALFQAGRFDDAIAELQKATQDPRRRIQARKYLGHSFYRKDLYDLAIKELERARKEIGDEGDENSKECSYLLGVIYEKRGDKADAKKAFERILESDYNYRDVVKRVEGLR